MQFCLGKLLSLTRITLFFFRQFNNTLKIISGQPCTVVPGTSQPGTGQPVTGQPVKRHLVNGHLILAPVTGYQSPVIQAPLIMRDYRGLDTIHRATRHQSSGTRHLSIHRSSNDSDWFGVMCIHRKSLFQKYFRTKFNSFPDLSYVPIKMSQFPSRYK